MEKLGLVSVNFEISLYIHSEFSVLIENILQKAYVNTQF